MIVEREQDGSYAVYAPALPGCASMGDTRAEALANIREAIACYLEGLQKLGRSAPTAKAEIEVVRVDAA